MSDRGPGTCPGRGPGTPSTPSRVESDHPGVVNPSGLCPVHPAPRPTRLTRPTTPLGVDGPSGGSWSEQPPRAGPALYLELVTTPGVRRLLAAVLPLLAATSLTVGLLAPTSSAAPSHPQDFNVRWFVEDRYVVVAWNEPAVALDGYEVTTEVDGQERSRTRLESGSLWNKVFLGFDPAGTAVRVSVRELRGSRPGPWETFVARIGAAAPAPVQDLHAESLPAEDELRLAWAPPDGAAGSDLEYHVSLTEQSNGTGTVDYLVDRPQLEIATGGVGVTLYAEVTAISSGGYGQAIRQRVVYEDVPGPAVELNPRPRAGGFNLKWQYAHGNQATSWANRFVLADVTGLETGTDYEIGVRGVNEHGAGEVLRATARTYDLPDQVAAPRVKPGVKGGGLSVRVSWTPPLDWGGGEECCYRITGHGPADRAGVPALVERWSDAPATRFDFPVGRAGKWSFQVEAKTGAGFSPISEPSRRVRAR